MPTDDPCFDTYPITPGNVAQIQPHVPHRMDLDAYDYFLNFFSE